MKTTASRKVFMTANYAFLLFFGLMTLFPFVYLLLVSLTPANEMVFITRKILHFPAQPQIEAYRQVFRTDVIPNAFRISVFITVVGTSLSMVVSTLLAFPLSRPNLPGKRVVQFMMVFTMLFNGGMIPTFLVVQRLGLINTVWSLILPCCVNAFNVIVMRNYFATLPESLDESAKLDGAGDYRILIQIYVPLGKPMLMALALFYAVGYWNAFFEAVMYINDSANYPLQVVLRQILLTASSENIFQLTGSTRGLSTAVRAATVIVTVTPIIILYPFVQRYFTQGLILGSVKQ